MECRKSVRELTATERTAYVNAVLALKTAPSLIAGAQTAVTAGGGTPNRYDDYVWMHSVVGGGAHVGPAFGPWHREFLRQFELDLRAVSGNPHISIPYWDWTVDRTPPDPGWPFTNTFMGGFGGSAPAFEVTTGPFSNPATWRINIRRAGDSVTRLKRSIGVPAPTQLPVRGTVTPSLTVGAYDASPYHSDPSTLTSAQRTAQANAAFRKYLEWLLHNGIHVWIGGINNTFTDGGHMTFPAVAVNDPVFFLHHANVDRLWTIWQQANPSLGYEPASGANAGHNATDVMSQFSNAANFNFPLANRPTDVLDWHARAVWYRSDLPVITPVSLSVNFGNIPENLATYRPVQFEVRTCQPVKFRITGVSGANYSIPSGQGTIFVQHSEVHDPVTANVYVQFIASGSLSTPQAGAVTIEAFIEDADGYFAPAVNGEYIVGSWTINLTATPVPRPRSAIVFVLDRSGSMSESAGPAGTKADLLKSALQSAADILQANDAIGLVSYDDVVATLASITGMGPLSPPGSGRTAVTTAITSGALDPRGLTAIGQGMIAGAGVLDAERTNPSTVYSRFAMLVMTDGNENVPPNVTSSAVTTAIAGFSNSVYAVGLGSETNVSAATLGAIAKYMLITGDITTAEQRFRLTKYFVQILASVTNTAIVVDPQGDLHLGVEHRIPFDITEADVSIDVIALSPAAFLLDFRLEAPDGTTIDPTTPSPNVAFHVGREDAFYRLGLPAIPGMAGTHAGRWTAIVRVSRRGGGIAATHAVDVPGLAAVVGKTGTLPYSVVVQAYSNVMFDAQVVPGVAEPGAKLALHARLTEYDVPVEGTATVEVEVRDPDGVMTRVALSQSAPGAFDGSFTTTLPGVYACRFRAAATSRGGRSFQREATRTAAIFKPLPSDPGGVGGILDEQRQRFCAFLACLLGRPGALGTVLERLGADPKAVARCLEDYCRPRRRKDRT
ncbi:MAG: tyrosinase family protein [Actinomycetota bacterium]|nr:tyrosinase family protein [Actinomycetota bacterium]